MIKPHDFTGERFGYLVALNRSGNQGQRVMWDWRCDCGSVKRIGSGEVKAGQIKSCGCKAGALIAERQTTHGHAANRKTSREMSSWSQAKQRCYNPKSVGWARYGGRGITMCDAWRDSFQAFLDDMGPRGPDLSLDRIDGNGNYEPGNCRWGTRAEQARNRCTNVYVDTEDGSMILKDYAAHVGVNYWALHAAMKATGSSAAVAAQRLSGRRA